MSRDRYTVRVMDTTSDEPRIKHAASYESREGASQAVDVLMDFFTLEETRIEVMVGDTIQAWLDTLESHETDKSDHYWLPLEGDTMYDPEAPDFRNGGTTWKEVTIVDVLPDTRADEHVVTVDGSKHIEPKWYKTVADKNPDEPSDAPVVIGTYAETDKQSEYAFPITRLEK